VTPRWVVEGSTTRGGRAISSAGDASVGGEGLDDASLFLSRVPRVTPGRVARSASVWLGGEEP
jgi:hypothetical protein